MLRVDLNADLAEGMANDQAILQKVTSVNIACGLHAGSAVEIQKALRWAKQYGVRVGAHPSFPDREDFGRRAMLLSDDELQAYLLYQLGALHALCLAEKVTMEYVKPHGALYNLAAEDAHLAKLIAKTVKTFNPHLKLMGLSNSFLISEAEQVGLETISEVFADRRYQAHGRLVPRSQPNAQIQSDEEAMAQVLQMVQQGSVTSITGEIVPVCAQSICLHGDGEQVLAFASKIRDALTI